MPLDNVTDAEAFPELIRQTYRIINAVAEALVMVRALNKMMRIGMSESVHIA